MSQTTFDQRVNEISKKHRILSDGANFRVGQDGLITAVPRRRLAPRFPRKGLLLLVGGVFAFKAALLLASGEATYKNRLAELAEGRPIEQVMAWVMTPDPVTRTLAASVDLAYQMASAHIL